ncbi:microtubule-associated protein futsch [Caerostris darwini]|uniref:Microtubule-associated protein futsch n=1 Tax=Caerostris darwini TaxID=1538125 RepID=A0AAV4TND1_9ARAC|nr:microtubule-associated protein futsch [Caerostris darwini]
MRTPLCCHGNGRMEDLSGRWSNFKVEMGLGMQAERLLSWDVESTGCDLIGLESVCSQIDEKHLNDNDVLIQHSTESLGVEVLVSPTVSTLKQCVKNLLSTSTGHKHLIHVGYAFAGSGSWILQNGTFSFDDFFEIFQQADVQSQKRCNVNIHCAEVGPWSSANFAEDTFAKVANVAFNPPEKASSVPGSEHLIKCLDKVLTSQALEEIMKASPLVGNIRFNRPTLYLFPAGQGDCALFGINGFNMLIDGGFNRKPCSWEFIRHLDRLDAVLVTRLCENNVCGMSTLMKRKSMNNTYPQIGYVFCNIAENNVALKSTDDLIISVVGEGHNFTQTLNELKLKPHQCWRDSSVEPFVLYHKVGHGTLEMHVLSPPKDSKEMKEFLSEWNSYKETFSRVNSSLKNKNLENTIPLSHSTSICAILVWRPADPKDTITRILFPGSAPQSKIFESLEKLKSLEVLKHPVVTKASLSVVAVTKSVSKIEKSVSKASIPNRKNTASPALSVSSVASRNGDIGGVKKEEKKDNKDLKQVVKKESKDLKAVIDKKSELKSTTKKIESTSVNKTSDIKKTSTVRKTTSTTTATKKDINQTLAVKKTEARKSAPPKLSETKSAKDVSNKKTAETKAVPKTKPKSANTTPKAAPKTKPAEQAVKPGNKMTKAVAASSVVASAVAVTVAALELNEKNDKIVDAEPEVAEELKEAEIADKSQEINVSPLPPEAVSPTPSESISLTPSDTLSSAPLETVSPTPPLTNEPISMEEKEVNEIKEIEQDLIPYEIEATQEGAIENVEQQLEDLNNKADEMELTHVKLQENADAMSTSFIGAQDIDTPEIEEVVLKNEAAPEQFSAANILGTYSEKNVEEAKFETEDGNKEISKDGDDDIEKKEMNIDDQLAHISMEGSFCAGRSPFQQENRDLPEDSNVKISEGEQCISDFIEQDIHNESESKEFGYNEKEHEIEVQESFVEEKQEVEKLESFVEKKQEIETLENFVEEKQEIETLENFVEETQEVGMPESFVEERQEIEIPKSFVEEKQEGGMPVSFVEEKQEVEMQENFVEEKPEVEMQENFVEQKQEIEMPESFAEVKQEVEMPESFIGEKQEVEKALLEKSRRLNCRKALS